MNLEGTVMSIYEGSRWPKKRWIAIFSQTGTEIADIIQTIKVRPDKILTNNPNPETISPLLEDRWEYYHKDQIEELLGYEQDVCGDRLLVTLHGYLKLITPETIQKGVKILNGHPADIESYPELKGKDPQEKYWENIDKFDSFGSVIHVVNEGVDEGNIVAKYAVDKSFMNIETKDDVYRALRTTSLNCWTQFFTMDGENSII